MSPAVRQFLARAERRVASMTPETRAAYLRVLANLIAMMDEAELAEAIASGQLERVLDSFATDDQLARAVLPLRQRLRQNVQQSFKFVTADLPAAGKIGGVVAVAFDHLSPTVIDAVRSLETDAINTLTTNVKETTRAYLENALRDGRPPAAVARELRDVIGLAPNEERYVENLRRELEQGQYGKAANRQLLDGRFNLAKLDGLSGDARNARIDTIVRSYRKNFTAFNAATNAKTHTFDSYKVGQQLAWKDAKSKGVIPDGYVLMKEWIHLDAQPNPRPTHEAMGKLPPVPADQPYTNGDMYAGESDPWNCHCADRYFVAKAA